MNGVCIGVGYLGCSIIWSREGHGDIVLTTPNRKNIYYHNLGPSATTDWGVLDPDSDTMGPENIYWPLSGSSPPTGVYYACFEAAYFDPVPSSEDPLLVTVTFSLPNNSSLSFTNNLTNMTSHTHNCSPDLNGFLGSFIYA
jgi:hypothetical protein